MKLSEKYKAIIEWIIAIVLVVICVYYYVLSYKSFTPLQAFKNSEKTMNYGPSEIIKELDKDNVKIYLAKYKNWFSAQAFERNLITWKFAGGSVSGTPINFNEKLTYSYSGATLKDNKFLWNLYGYVNDINITKVRLQVKRGDKTESLEYQLDKSNMFIFSWFNNNGEQSTFTKIIGLDKDNKVIYEFKFPGSGE
jgi:hypothetical protein